MEFIPKCWFCQEFCQIIDFLLWRFSILGNTRQQSHATRKETNSVEAQPMLRELEMGSSFPAISNSSNAFNTSNPSSLGNWVIQFIFELPARSSSKTEVAILQPTVHGNWKSNVINLTNCNLEFCNGSPLKDLDISVLQNCVKGNVEGVIWKLRIPNLELLMHFLVNSCHQ